MTYSLELEVELPDSLNTTLRLNRFTRNKKNDYWDNLIFFLTKGRLPPYPLHSARLTFIRYHYRILDYDGFVGGLKPVADALQFAGVIKNDSYYVTGPWECSQLFMKKKEGSKLWLRVTETEINTGLKELKKELKR